MALLGNFSVLHKTPGRFRSGLVAQYPPRSRGSDRARFASWAGYDSKSATPNGYTPPGAWIMAQKPGGMAANFSARGSLSAALAAGQPIEANLEGSGELTPPELALVVSMAANLVGSGTVSAASMYGALQMAANLSGSGELTATPTALAHLEAALHGQSTVTVTAFVLALMEASITSDSAELTPQSIATAVWTLQQAGFDDPGSFGANLNAPVGSIGGGSITEEGIADEVLEVLVNDPRFLSVAKFLGLK